MKISLFCCVITIILSTSCSGTKTVLDPTTNTIVKVYEAEDFSFYYPKRWQKLNVNKTYFDSVIVSVSPKKEIFPLFIAQDTINGKVYKFRGNKEESDTYKNKQGTIDDDAGEFSYARIHLWQTDLNQLSFSEFLALKIDQIKSYATEIKKTTISQDLFILTYRFQGYNRTSEFRFAAAIHKVYYYKHDNKVYEMSYSASEYKYSDYLDEATYTLSSLKFK